MRNASWLIVLMVLLGSLPAGGEPVRLDTLLARAESVRSAEPKTFNALLAQLNHEYSRADEKQKREIEYLNAYQQTFSGNYERSVALANELIAKSPGPELAFRAGLLIVNSDALSGRFNEGLREIERTFSLMDRVSDPDLRQQALVAAATLYSQLGQYKLAHHYAGKVVSAPVTGRHLCFASYFDFDALLHLNAMPSDDGPVKQAIAQCMAQREVMMANAIRGVLAKTWAARGDSDKALAAMHDHLNEISESHYPRLIAESNAFVAELLLQKNDLEAAEAKAKVAVSQTADLSNSPPVVSAFRTLYQIAERRRDFSTALAYYKRFAASEKGYLNEVKTRELAYQIVRNENQQKSQQIELLNRQNNVLQLKQQVDQQAAANSHLYMLLFALLAATISYWAYKNKRVHMSVKRMAETDALTGICNRHHFTIQSQKTLQRCAAAGEPVSLLMFDLDYFKSINDNYGHVTGDWVLRRIAVVSAELCRGIDHLGRIGGEEFAILLHGCDLKAAARVADDCRVRLSRIDPSPSGYTFPISASFGVSSTSASGYDFDQMLSHADQMLYRAKREGRNRVRVYAPDHSHELTGGGLGKATRPADSTLDAENPARPLRA